MVTCVGCGSIGKLSDCKQFVKCNGDCGIYKVMCSCGSTNQKTDGSTQQCLNCGVKTCLMETIPYFKPKFNGVYPENNSYQYFYDISDNTRLREPTWFEKLKFNVKKFLYGDRCELY